MKYPTDTCSVCGSDLTTAVPKAHIWVRDGVTYGDCPGCGVTYVMVEEKPEPVTKPEPEPAPEPVAEPEPET